jgi:pimeloyl-ACP methyl ester carboxylesterase
MIARDGVKLFYEDTGAGEPPLVFVHGWTCNHTYFAPQLEAFAPDHRVVAVDLRGHGESDKPEATYSIKGFADDVAWLIGALRVRRPVVVGHSMGGAIVLQLAADHPELVAGAVMVDAAPIGADVKPMIAAVVQAMTGSDHAASRAGFIDAALFSEFDDQARRARIVAEMASAPQHVAVSCFQALVDWDGEAAAKAVGVPVLHIGASNPINDAAVLRALNPRIQTAQTAYAGHFNQLEVPEQVNPMIARFLEVCRPAVTA